MHARHLFLWAGNRIAYPWHKDCFHLDSTRGGGIATRGAGLNEYRCPETRRSHVVNLGLEPNRTISGKFAIQADSAALRPQWAGRWPWLSAIPMGILLFVSGLTLRNLNSVPPAPRLVEAESFVLHGDLPRARAELVNLLDREPHNSRGRALLGTVEARVGNLDAAAEAFEGVALDSADGVRAQIQAAELRLLKLFQPLRAEACLQEVLQQDPANAAAQALLAGLYGMSGCSAEGRQLRWERIRESAFTETDLILLALGDTASENAALVEQLAEKNPSDPWTRLAIAHQAFQKHELEVSLANTRAFVAARPDVLSAQARLGRLLLLTGDRNGFLEWHTALPVQADDSAEIWAVRAERAELDHDLNGTLRCDWEAVRRDATHLRAHYRLGQLLPKNLATEFAAEFQARHAHLLELILAAKAHAAQPSLQTMRRLIRANRAAELPWETWAWSMAARLKFGPKAATAMDQPASDTPRVNFAGQLALQCNLSGLPLPRWMSDSGSRKSGLSSGAAHPVATNSPPVRFVEEAEAVGLSFRYVNGDTLSGPGMQIFRFSGGGLGVLDYDADGWPDLHCAQGGMWPAPAEQPQLDRLFRNRRGRNFIDVTERARIVEDRYSQGVAVGDYDSDGFPDLFVANVAGDRLFHNSGDGTFVDVSTSAGLEDDGWSTSAAFADFNRDGLADLYVVNYLTGTGLLERICQQADGSPRACTPHEFPAADDVLRRNTGDGVFVDVTDAAGVRVPEGKGLGVVAGDFLGTGSVDLFVANDTTANFYFRGTRGTPDPSPWFREDGISMGIAYDREGLAQACMGIAVGDADGNGLADLFVTNYYKESNTLYSQREGGQFFDDTAHTGLREPSLKQLGFGTQFLDADLDGWEDLIVTNGHVDDETRHGVPLHMPTQYFRNAGGGQFQEVSAEELGEWFAGRYLGRALARWDWNRDGRPDIAISCLDSPHALLTNATLTNRHSLRMRLVATSTERTAIGARISLTTPQRTQTKWLTAGDGYLTSQERIVSFGIADQNVFSATIHWPSGEVSTYFDLSIDSEYVVVEGRMPVAVSDHN